MRVRILGPLEVVQDGIPLTLGGPKPRAILAALALRRGQVVGTDQLVTAAWGDSPPRDAVGTLQANVSRLRAVLHPHAADPLQYRAPGYVLNGFAEDLDAAQFIGGRPLTAADVKALAAGAAVG